MIKITALIIGSILALGILGLMSGCSTFVSAKPATKPVVSVLVDNKPVMAPAHTQHLNAVVSTDKNGQVLVKLSDKSELQTIGDVSLVIGFLLFVVGLAGYLLEAFNLVNIPWVASTIAVVFGVVLIALVEIVKFLGYWLWVLGIAGFGVYGYFWYLHHMATVKKVVTEVKTEVKALEQDLPKV